MKTVIDANVLFAALLKDGMTRRLLFNPDLQLYAPKFIAREYLKYRTYLLGKYAYGEKKFDALIRDVLSFIELVPDRELKPYLPAARTLVSDPKDWLYVAVALKENAAVWSNDKDLKAQTRIPVYSTAELAKKVGIL
ncbi:PIN domain-containing protein [Candidatus Micrarchaeota archaeon]|nr:PIN domain-containing protein [Candidatus Micrarchaeota archaeon]